MGEDLVMTMAVIARLADRMLLGEACSSCIAMGRTKTNFDLGAVERQLTWQWCLKWHQFTVHTAS